MRALFGLLILGCSCGQVAAAETGTRWWPFGGKPQPAESQVSGYPAGSAASVAQPGEQQPAITPYEAPEAEQRWMIESPFAKVSWPRIHMPELPKPTLPTSVWPKKSQLATARNTWMEPDPSQLEPSPLQSVKNGANRVKQSTRNAWNKTVDLLTPGDASSQHSSRVAHRDSRPLWERMFSKEPTQPEGPQTVTQWMAQDRVDQ